MRNFIILALASFLMSVVALSCSEGQATEERTEKATMDIPQFNYDSAYSYIERQCSFGPRVPGTEAHQSCLDWIVSFFKENGADTVIVQKGETTLYDSTKKTVLNVIAVYGQEKENRVMLSSHWDSRPFADMEILKENRQKPIPGADDGASGVGVLMEVARIMNNNRPKMGVDIILFDLEDWGAPEWLANASGDNGWCLGSQYWALHTHIPGYKAQFGILLDMVGGSESRFFREYFSETSAKWLNDKIWNTAKEIGLSNRFIDQTGGAITDDHIPVMQHTGIPCIDIVSFNPEGDAGFPDYWHTLHDNMDNISKATLADVGKLLLTLLYQ
ncbi:MAG: M28 family peptidase [Paludibacteraceae bacterium]|nr:M28 family peptidase [Paludibacteraceae bacterium]